MIPNPPHNLIDVETRDLTLPQKNIPHFICGQWFRFTLDVQHSPVKHLENRIMIAVLLKKYRLWVYLEA